MSAAHQVWAAKNSRRLGLSEGRLLLFLARSAGEDGVLVRMVCDMAAEIPMSPKTIRRAGAELVRLGLADITATRGLGTKFCLRWGAP